MSGEYEQMGREELLARLIDWRQVANDRSAEIRLLDTTIHKLVGRIADLELDKQQLTERLVRHHTDYTMGAGATCPTCKMPLRLEDVPEKFRPPTEAPPT